MNKANTTHRTFGLVSALVLGSLLSAAIPLSIIAQNDSSFEVEASVGNYTTNPATYYNSVSGLSGNSLLFGLHDLMISSHQKYTSYDDSGSNGYQAYTDKDPNNSNNIIAWYSHASIPSTWDSGATYNREHVWPQSLSNGLYGESYAGADMHHIRPTISYINNYRSNSKYGYVSGGSTTTYGTGNLVSKYTSSVFEPHDEVKGDAARIVMYMYVHYNSSQALGNGSTVEPHTGTLPVNNVIDGANAAAAWDLLLDWNSLDPVDTLETNRNNQVSIYQGNRNPFIDHPEYADLIWGTASAPTSLSLSPSSANVSIGHTTSLSVTAYPSGSSTSVTWSSSNNSIATVANGVVTGVATGNATITATSTLNTSVKATASIAVSNVPVSSVSLDATASLNVGSTMALTPTILPADATDKTVTWSSSNTSVATINSSTGLITGVSAGNTTITVTTNDGNKTDTCSLTVVIPSNQTATYAITAKNTVTLSGVAPSGSTASLVETYSTSKQMTGGNSQTLTLSGWNNNRITGITLSMKSNTSSGAGNFTYSVDGGTNFTTLIATNSFSASAWNGAWSTIYVPIEITGLNISASTADLVFKISATLKSLYCESYSFTYEPVVASKSLSSIAVTTQPTNKTYTAGQGFNPAGMVVTATYSDSTTADVTGSCTYSPNPLTQGTTSVTVSYTESSVTKTTSVTGITVNAAAATLSSIAVSGTPTKTTYFDGESFNPAGITVTATYSDSSTANVTSSCTYTPNPLTQGTSSVTVSYTEGTTKTATVSGLTVNANNVESISIKTPASNTIFTLGSTFSSDGLEITITYSNLSTQDLTTGFVVSGVDTSSLGVQTATITYVGQTTSYNVTVTNNGASVAGGSGGFATDLFISEYIEGASYNKAIEIYNGTGASVNLSGYSLKLYSNGSKTVSQSLTLSGTLTNNDVHVLAHDSAAADILAVTDTTNQTVINFNGDDSVALFNGTTLIDLFGDITTGTDPGTSWTVTDYNSVSVSTHDKTFIRHSSIASPSATSPFLANQWVAYAVGTHSYLGSHTFSGGQSSGDVTSEEQAEAWAQYFLNLTGPTCTAMSGDFSSYWTTLANEYGFMASDSKDVFVDNVSNNVIIANAQARYIFIVQKYGINNFVIDGSGGGIVSSDLVNQDRQANTPIAIIVIFTIVLITMIGAILVLKRKNYKTFE
ncbi:MAG: endonuclease [Bacilli bacterium]